MSKTRYVDATFDKRDIETDGTKLDTIEESAEVNNISDVNATDLTNGSNSTLHYHESDRSLIELTLIDFQANAATGTMYHPEHINIGDTDDESSASSVGMYCEIEFDKPRNIKQFRHYGGSYQTGAGAWRIQHWNGTSWVNNTSGIVTRSLSSGWSDWIDLTIEVITDKIRLVCQTLDPASGINTSYIGELEILGNTPFIEHSPAVAATATLDVSISKIHDITMPAGNITIAVSNETNGDIFQVRILQDSTGSRTVSWFSSIKWAGGSAPTLTTTGTKADTFVFRCTGVDEYDGFIVGQNI